MNTITRRALAAAAALSITAVGAAVTTTPAGATSAAYCGITWGSLPKTNSTYTAGAVTNLRSGRHDCFDRLVLDIGGRPAGYRVEYVDRIVQDGSGTVVPVRGGAKIKITAHAPGYDENGDITYQPANPKEAVNVTGYSTLRQVRWLGSFEGTSELGVGVRARLPFRVIRLDDGAKSRLVIDIAHRW